MFCNYNRGFVFFCSRLNMLYQVKGAGSQQKELLKIYMYPDQCWNMRVQYCIHIYQDTWAIVFTFRVHHYSH